MPIFGIMSKEDFVKWFRFSGFLKIFWIKPLIRARWLDKNILEVEWVSRRSRGAIIFFEEYDFSISKSDYDTIIITRSEDLRKHSDAEGILFIWLPGRHQVLEPNNEIIIKIKTVNSAINISRKIQKLSWGFYASPCENDIIFIAYLHNEPVGCAYLNRMSHNIDYGIHVIRKMWRKRIGTRILSEILTYAKEKTWPFVTVIRVFRRLGGTKADRIAINFYLRNRPHYVWRVFRLKNRKS